MNMKKTLPLCALATALLLTACSNGTPQTSPQTTSTPELSAPSTGGAAVRTGLSLVADVSSSTAANGEIDGIAQSDVTVVAVTLDDEGVIGQCVIDGIRARVVFDDEGDLETDRATRFASKNELETTYGMKAASSIGREWNEQAAALAQYAVGKTVEELKGMALNEKGQPTDADLSSSVTMSVAGLVEGIAAAANNADYRGARSGDRLTLACMADMADSTEADDGKEGVAKVNTTVAAVTWKDDLITGCTIDSVQTEVSFDETGLITSDIFAPQPTKNELGDAYGMGEVSPIGKEWDQQVEAFCAYISGKTVEQVMGIAVDERTAPKEADLKTSVTIAVGPFQSLVQKAAGR